MAPSIVINRSLFRIDGVVLSPRQIKQFWSQVKRSTIANDCWLWQGELSDDGHGRFTASYQDGTTAQLWAHRAAYSLSSLTQVETGLVVRHTCGLAPCCNPLHLTTGTSKDNARDTALHRAMLASLTPEQIAIIKASRACLPHMAQRFGVTNGIVWNLRFPKPSARKVAA